MNVVIAIDSFKGVNCNYNIHNVPFIYRRLFKKPKNFLIKSALSL